MWGLHALNKLNPEKYLDDPNEHIRAWAIRLMMDGQPIDTLLGPREKGLPTTNPKLVQKLVQQARIDSSGLVRLTLASALQRLPISLRRELAKGLASRQEDANDHNLPMIVWAGITPMVENDPDGLLALPSSSQWPVLRTWIARAITERSKEQPMVFHSLLDLIVETT